MFPDLGFVFTWWLFIFGIGLIFLPLTKKIFADFFDKGYLFSKVLGLLFSSYLVWLLATFKILPFSRDTIWLVLVIGLIVNLILLRKKISLFPGRTGTSHSQPIFHSPSLFLIFILEELMFLATLAFWSFIRGFQPDIQGLEKFMDFGFVNSILRSKYFPPADMWFAGKSINYYYYGHYVAAFLTKLTGIDSAITYNLMIATLFAFTFSLTFSLTGNLVYFWKKNVVSTTKSSFHLTSSIFCLIVTAGLISALLISLGANLHPAYYNFKMEILKKPYCDGSFSYWYPNATRYIGYCPEVEDKTIHEFPSYSFIVSDLHGHVSDIPFVLFFLALCLKLILSFACPPKPWRRQELCALSLLMSWTLAVMFMTNQWDYPIYLMVLGLVLLWSFFERQNYSLRALARTGLLGIAVVLLSAAFFLPFQLGFEPIAKGIGFVRAHSLPHQLLILWGAPWFFGLTFLLFLFGKQLKPKQIFKKTNIIKWLSKILGVEVELKTEKSPPLITNYQLLIPDVFILVLFLVSTILVIIPEIIYVKDIYIPSYHRANTMFKLTYQSFMMFSISIGYIFIRVFTSLKKGFSKKMFFALGFTLLASLMVYPLYSIKGYYGDLDTKNYKGLYGLKFIQRLYPDDYRAIIWLNKQSLILRNKNVSDQPHILEAVGDSYTDYERISMATGLPTIEGWLVHEWLWRGSFDEPGKRSSEVQTIYEASDVNQTKQLLKKYRVKYLLIGEMERQKYPNINEEKLKKLGKKVFESGKTTIYELF